MCSRTTSLLVTVILLLSVVACQKDKEADGSKDLRLASQRNKKIREMQNTIADLTGVVGHQTKAISEVMIWLEKLQSSMEDNKMLIASSTNERAELASNVNELKNSIATELDEVKTTISNIGSEVEIVSSEEEGGNPKCAKVCTGTTGRTSTSWSNRGSWVNMKVTIQGCGFVKVPTVTTSIEGTSEHYLVTGASAVYSVTTSSFTICLKGDSNTASNARDYDWNVEWIAVGYTC